MTVAVLPLSENTRIDLRVEPPAFEALDGSKLSEDFRGIWFTKFTPMYSNFFALEMEAGRIIEGIPQCLVNLSLYLASKYVNGVQGKCATMGDCDPYYQQIRGRYTLLRGLLGIISSDSGVGNVVKKVLGDFEIQFGYADGDANVLSRLLDEMKSLESVILSGGCLGLGTSLRPLGMVKGACDPYRPVIGRTWYEPQPGTSGNVIGKGTPRSNRGSYRPERFRGVTRRVR